jgi:hypothetical protein
MFKSTEEWAQELIAAGRLRSDAYLEISNLDPRVFVFVYVRLRVLRVYLSSFSAWLRRNSAKSRRVSISAKAPLFSHRIGRRRSA